jgi:anti-sigma28 factor (negative regulator of flagellin synthesis)
MRIDGLPNLPKVEQSNQRNEAVRQKRSGAKPGDSVEISDAVRESVDLAAALKVAPEQPNPRISEVRERVRAGYYNSEEVKQQVAGALLRSEGMRPAVDEVAQVQVANARLQSVPDTRPERVEQARQRVTEGFYDRPEVRRTTADRIVDELA